MTIPLFLSTDAVALIRWARRLPGDGSRETVYRPRHQGGLATGEFAEREAVEFLHGDRDRWEAVKHELGQHFVDGELEGNRMLSNFTCWGCWRLTRAAEVISDEAPAYEWLTA